MSESGSKVVVSKAARVDIVDPWRAAKHDPTMSEWLRLTPSDSCPEDPTHGWGTTNPRGYLSVRRCNEPSCGAKFRPHVDAQLVAEVAQALVGTPRRFIMEWADGESDPSAERMRQALKLIAGDEAVLSDSDELRQIFDQRKNVEEIMVDVARWGLEEST